MERVMARIFQQQRHWAGEQGGKKETIEGQLFSVALLDIDPSLGDEVKNCERNPLRWWECPCRRFEMTQFALFLDYRGELFQCDTNAAAQVSPNAAVQVSLRPIYMSLLSQPLRLPPKPAHTSVEISVDGASKRYTQRIT